MKKITFFSAAIIIIITLSGCGVATKTIVLKSQSERTDIFKEVSATDLVPSGYADVLIKANIKTHLEGYYIGESKKSAHGKPSYPFLINIEGQAVVWNVPGVIDKKPAYDDNGKMSLDPEAREGMKYVLEKKIQLPRGKHAVFFALPEESYYTIAEIEIKDGGSYILEFKAVYNYRTFPTRVPTFFRGIKHYDVVFRERKEGT